MSTDSPLTFRVAQQAGSPNKPSEDRVFLTPNASIVLDGASQWTPLERSGGWIADELGGRLQTLVSNDPSRSLPGLLDDAVDDLLSTFELKPGKSPSTTVNIVRAVNGYLDVLVLCDSPVFVLDLSGQVHEIRDQRLASVGRKLKRPPGPFDLNDKAWKHYIRSFESLRNQPGGFWCVSASRQVSQHAVSRRFTISEIDSVLAVTDGVSVGVDRYGKPSSWAESFALASKDPELLINTVTAVEARDLQHTNWPRQKTHDDKSVSYAKLNQSVG